MFQIMEPFPNEDPRRTQLPLDITSAILSYVKSPADLARVARTSRINHFLIVPLLYHTVTLRRPSRRPDRTGWRRMALGALAKPGIAGCVKVLKVDDDGSGSGDGDGGLDHGGAGWWERGEWSDEETVWAVAVAGVLAGMTRLDEFLWETNNYIHPLLYTALVRHRTLKVLRVSLPPLPPPPGLFSGSGLASASTSLGTLSGPDKYARPPITIVPAFRTLRSLVLHNLPGISSFTDDFLPAVFFSPNLESLSLSWRTPTPLGRMLFLQKLLKHPRPTPAENGPGATGRQGFRDIPTGTEGKLRLKELSLRNVIFDFPTVGNFSEWVDTRQLEKLSILDCDILDAPSWLELISAGGPGRSNSAQSSFSLTHDSPMTSPMTTTSSTPGAASITSLSVPPPSRSIRLNLKSLRINSCASPWISVLNSFDGLEEIYILDPPVVEPDEAANGEKFMDAITQHHGATLRRLRLCSRWNLERMDTSRLFKACAKLEELAFSMPQSQWIILDVVLIFLAHLRFLHIIGGSTFTRDELVADLESKMGDVHINLAQDDLIHMQAFAFSDVVYRVDRTAYWDEREKHVVRRGRFTDLDEVREWAGIWRAEKI